MLDIAGDRRIIAKNIRFSQKEWDVVNQKMMECEISEFSEYARLACLQLDPVIFDIESFASLLNIRKDLKDFISISEEKVSMSKMIGSSCKHASRAYSLNSDISHSIIF